MSPAPVNALPDPASAPARASRTAEHRGLRIAVTATRRITGVTLVVTEVSGGPDKLKRNFYTVSQEPDPTSACAEAIASMQRVLDQQAPFQIGA